MHSDSESVSLTQNYETMSLVDVFSLILKRKWLLIVCVVIGIVSGMLYALSLPNLYRADAVLAPASTEGNQGLSSLTNQLGGLASLTGFDLGGGSQNSTVVTLAILKSRKFLIGFVDKYDLSADLLAVKEWQRNSGLIYDDALFSNGTWLYDNDDGSTLKPSHLELHKEMSKILFVSQNPETGLVNVSIEHQSPIKAKQWTGMIVNEINDYMKKRDEEEATIAIEYLYRQIEKTELTGGKKLLFEFLEEQEKKLMFTQIRAEYVFTIIDPALEPEIKFKPKRSLIVIIFTMAGLLIGIFIILFFHLTALFEQTKK